MPEAAGSGEPRLVEIADGVYAYLQPDGGWCLNNAGVIADREGVLLVDTAATERRALRLRAEVDALGAGERRVVVNTHFHGDHTLGNSVFGPAAVVVSHALTREDMAQTGLSMTALWPDVHWGDLRVALPDLTYTDSLTVHLGDRRVELLHFGPAHTRSDTVVWLPEERVLFAGDIVMPGHTPFVLMGTVAGSLAVLDRLRELDPVTVVGGHGPVAGPEAFDETEAYLRRLQHIADEYRPRGATPLEAARDAGLGEFAKLPEAERLVGNLHRAWLEAEGGELARPVDPVAVFQEIVTYNDGRLPTCHA
ncbi:MBL fold metallo-hydrolase [Streptomyces sp. NPDC000070]|uniref:MBL fold metallo-hydrolase n=1 Tax=Streptomyces sp. NPDC000070 TaxID=3154240 RepID=UPI00331687D2